MVKQFELTARDLATSANITQFNQKLAIMVQNDEHELAGIDTDSLRLYYLDETTDKWVPVADSKYDTTGKVLTATTTHFSNYAEIGNSLTSGPGRVMASEVQLHSGAATFNYPIELPPGPGGFQPKLQLSYSSGSVDEMKNKQATASWVGAGWSLHLGRISLDLGSGKYFLDLNGGSYELTTLDKTNYRTNPDQYFKITRSGNIWDMWDKDGMHYQFGGDNANTNSQQYLSSTIYYRWDLNLIQDTNGNQATVSYIQDVEGTAPNAWVRSAYPEYLRYNGSLIEVHFISSAPVDRGADGFLRLDDPITYQYYNSHKSHTYPAPKIMETRELDSLEVRVNSNILRKYSFQYNIIGCGDGNGKIRALRPPIMEASIIRVTLR